MRAALTLRPRKRRTNVVRLLAIILPLLSPQQAWPQEADGDPARGETIFMRCAACHAVAEDRNGAGPHLVGLIGRPAGAAEGFRYSDALSQSDLTWDRSTLSAYLLEPGAVLPGTRKAGVLTDPQDVADVVAYLATLDP